ncbi:MAG: zinc ribbon domain-containing protein [Planctomycetota bacterium]
MPTYEYRCDANDRTVEVSHAMSTTLTTWGDLTDAAGIEPGDTPADAPIERVISLANIGTSGSASTPPPHSCGPGCCMHQ